MFNNQSHGHFASGDYLFAGLKAGPPVAVSGAAAAGLSLEEWVFAITLVYLVLQCTHLVWKWLREIRAGRVVKEDA